MKNSQYFQENTNWSNKTQRHYIRHTIGLGGVPFLACLPSRMNSYNLVRKNPGFWCCHMKYFVNRCLWVQNILYFFLYLILCQKWGRESYLPWGAKLLFISPMEVRHIFDSKNEIHPTEYAHWKFKLERTCLPFVRERDRSFLKVYTEPWTIILEQCSLISSSWCEITTFRPNDQVSR